MSCPLEVFWTVVDCTLGKGYEDQLLRHGEDAEKAIWRYSPSRPSLPWLSVLCVNDLPGG
jgi:hypothetical protein